MSRSAFRLLIVVLLALISRPAFAQQDTSIPDSSLEIDGQLRSPDEGTSFKNIIVRLERFGGGLVDQRTTDSMGRFRFTNLQPGQYTVSAYAPGFTAEPQQVEVYRQLIRRGQVFLTLRPDKLTAGPAVAPGMLDAKVPAEAQKEYQKGQAALEEKNTKKAIPHLEKAVKLYPGFYQAQLLLGTTYMDGRQWNEAEGALRRALEIDPNAPEALVYLGEVYRRNKKYTEAETALQAALKLDDSSWQGHFTLGRVYLESRNLVKAGHHVGRTIQLRPEYADAHLLGGNILMQVGLLKNALIEYEEYLRLEPKGQFADQTRAVVDKIKKALAEQKK